MRDILDSLFAYKPIPSVLFGVGRMQGVEYWRTLLIAFGGTGPHTGLLFSLDLVTWNSKLTDTHLRSGLSRISSPSNVT